MISTIKKDVHNYCITDIPMFRRGGTSDDKGCECLCFLGFSCSTAVEGPTMLLPFPRCPDAGGGW